MGTLGFKKTIVGSMFAAKFHSSLGRHTRTHWFVNAEREPVSTIAVDIEGVQFEFLPRSKVLAVKYTADVLSKIAELAQREIDGSLTQGEPESLPNDKTTMASLIRQAATNALNDDDIEKLSNRGIKWQPPLLSALGRHSLHWVHLVF